MNGNKTLRKQQQEDFITIPDLWRLCVVNWPWFVVSLVVCLGLACYYLYETPNMYTREASVLIRQEISGKGADKAAGDGDFQNFGLVVQNTNVSNVQRELSSLNVLTEVARRVNHTKSDREAVMVAKDIKSRLEVDVEDDKSTVINLKYTSESPTNAERVLYEIVQVYNEKWIENKNQMTMNTSRFIEVRLRLLENDLDNVDDSISSFKARNKITDLDRVSDIYLQQQSQSEAEILRVSNQRAMAQYLLDILKSKSSGHQLLPTNSGINNDVAESQIVNYNTLLMQLRNNLVNTSAQNPLIAQQESDLDEIRKNILSTLSSHIKNLDIQLQTLEDYNDEANSKISSNPSQAKHLVSVQREQKVKESLYLYLLQKKEENEIGMTYSTAITKIIDMPNGSDKPTSPNKRLILVLAVLFALVVPVVVIFMNASFDNTVRDRSDIERRTTLSLLGCIPLCKSLCPGRFKRMVRGSKKSPLVVGSGQQDSVNEAFRLVRTKMEFMTARQGDKNVYVVTSSYVGSGKTFISINVAMTLAISGKRVLLIDGDLRHASASHVFNSTDIGLADYLMGRVDDIFSILHQSEQNENLDVLPVGTVPPNPTELLSGDRFANMLDQLRTAYDFIIIDCPPAETLADAGIIERCADRTLFVLRAGLFERSRLADLENDVNNGRFKHMLLILNATKAYNRYGYYYSKYGYKYGYGKNHYGKY